MPQHLISDRDEALPFPAPYADHSYSASNIRSTSAAEPVDAAVQVDLVSVLLLYYYFNNFIITFIVAHPLNF